MRCYWEKGKPRRRLQGTGALGSHASNAGLRAQGGELCVCDLSWISGRKQALVSPHLRLLRSEGLVASRRGGKLMMYSLTDEGASLLCSVLGKEERVTP